MRRFVRSAALVAAGAASLAALSLGADAQGAAVPDLQSGGTAWLHPPGGAFPSVPGSPPTLRQDPAHPYHGNNSGLQPTYHLADLSNPNLKQWAKDIMKKDNEEVLGGKIAFSERSSCLPAGVPQFDLYGGLPIFFVQTPKEVLIIYQGNNEIRHIYLGAPHSRNPEPSWYGESVGHYEGDALVVDTIGLNAKAHVDSYRTPHTEKMHVTERWHLIDGGKALQADITVDDPGTYEKPWSTFQRYQRGRRTLEEDACAENNQHIDYHMPVAEKPDFCSTFRGILGEETMTESRAPLLDRRSFAAGAVLCGALAASARLWPASAAANPGHIDVHHHVSPPVWLDAVKKANLANPPMANWSVQKSLDDMDRGGVATAMVSPTAPQVGFLGPEEAARIARESNEYVRKLMADHPGRFGLFAMLPLPHVDESLKAIAYAFDTLKADGIGMLTSYGDKWLGHPDFAPVFDELNRRKATVYTHPASPVCCANLVAGVPAATVEYGADTTRAITNLIFSGASLRAPGINFIFSHGGGVLTAVVERLQIQMPEGAYKGKVTRATVDGELRRFYYDTAQIANSITIKALVDLVPVSQVVFGTDFPYRTAAEHAKGLAERFHGADLEAIERGNALRFLPRLRAA